MRLFQNCNLYPGYISRLRRLVNTDRFASQIDEMLLDGYAASHLLLPVLKRSKDAFLVNGNDIYSQRLWARENGMPKNTSDVDILLAQIEHHRTEVFYNLDPIRFHKDLPSRLPGSVKAKIAWLGADLGKADLSKYNLIVCNFPSLLEKYRKNGLRAAYFSPAIDPVMSCNNNSQGRSIDVSFVGTFSRHHKRRTSLLAAIAELSNNFDVALHLEISRFTEIAESSFIRHFISADYLRPESVRRIAQGPIYGRDLYRLFSSTRIVVNGAIDMAGDDRGNIRCFETLATGALLVSDIGHYPEGMVDQETMVTYKSNDDLIIKVTELLQNPEHLAAIASRGLEMVQSRYSKETQWQAFQGLVDLVLS